MIEPPTAARIHPRQRIAWAHWRRYMGYGYDDSRYDRKKNLEAWKAAAHGEVTVVQYYSDNFAEPWVMPPFAQAIFGGGPQVPPRPGRRLDLFPDLSAGLLVES